MPQKGATNPRITTILFDWAGVFCSPGEPFSHPRMLKELGMTPEEMERRVHGLYRRYYRGTVTSSAFWRSVISTFGLKGYTIKELNEAYLRSYRLYPGALAIPSRLRTRYTVALISNLTDEMMRHIVRTHDLKRRFDALFFSNRLGMMKPEPQMFRHVLRSLHARPEETLFIDDTRSNIAAAKTLGMRTIHCRSAAQLKRDLGRHGLI